MQPNYCLQTYAGHKSHVMSLDFHPKKNDLFCSCDANNEIRFWNINQYSSIRVFKVSVEPLYSNSLKVVSNSGLFLLLNLSHLMMQGGSAQVRFQPRIGQFMAAASGNVVSIFDAESDRQTHSLQVRLAAVNFTKGLKVSFLICIPSKSMLYLYTLLLIRQHNLLNSPRATPQRCILFVGMQMEIIWLRSVKSLSECGHYPLGSAFMSSVLVETCFIPVFSIQATPLSWSLEATR